MIVGIGSVCWIRPAGICSPKSEEAGPTVGFYPTVWGDPSALQMNKNPMWMGGNQLHAVKTSYGRRNQVEEGIELKGRPV